MVQTRTARAQKVDEDDESNEETGFRRCQGYAPAESVRATRRLHRAGVRIIMLELTEDQERQYHEALTAYGWEPADCGWWVKK